MTSHVAPTGHAPPLEHPPPALVLGSGITALGVVRALGRAGIPLHVLTADPGFVRTSRWYAPPPHRRPLVDSADLASYLRALPLERGVLIPTSDHEVLAAARLPDDLRARFPVSQAPAGALEIMLDKGRLRSLLAEHDIPHPRTVPADALDTADPPLDLSRTFIKPCDSQAFNRRLRVKALPPSSPADLRRTLEWLATQGLEVVLQEYVPGPPTNHYFLDGFVDRTGIVRGLLARKRLRMSSPRFGNSCATVSVPLEEVGPAVADLERLLRAVAYRGPFDAEFKKDERDGAYRLLEVNVRAWWQVEFAALCGLDVVTMAYRDALGLQVADAPPYTVGLEWILPYHDAVACRDMLRRGELGIGAWIGSWIRSRWGGFAWDDPMPGVAAGLELWQRRKRARARPGPATPASPRSLHRKPRARRPSKSGR